METTAAAPQMAGERGILADTIRHRHSYHDDRAKQSIDGVDRGGVLWGVGDVHRTDGVTLRRPGNGVRSYLLPILLYLCGHHRHHGVVRKGFRAGGCLSRGVGDLRLLHFAGGKAFAQRKTA